MILVRVRRPDGRESTLEMGEEKLQDVMDRANRTFGNPEKYWDPHIDYELRKSAWLRTHPEAKPEDITRAFRAIADALGI